MEARVRATRPPAAAECDHLGKPAPPPAGRDRRKRYSLCTHPGQPLGPVVCGCEGCGPACPGYEADSPPPEPRAPFEWVSTARLAADSVTLAGMLPPDCSAVAGIPRSGMIPASIIAAHLQLPLFELTDGGRLNRLGHGSRGRNLGFPAGGGPVAVVDDTVYAGGAMRRARESMRRVGERGVFCAVYVRPESRDAADRFARELPSPHLLEWNLLNCGVAAGRASDPAFGRGVAADLDGVILHDAESGGPVGSPYLVPRGLPVPLIATGRHERHRATTEEQLRRWGVKWSKLVMLPDDTELTPENAAAHKAGHFRRSGCGFFLESCPVQAESIHRATRKPVVCPRIAKVFQ